jgi:hypothetical protein
MNKTDKIVGALTLIAIIAMVVAYFAPIWWVSLTAPNYPEEAFPDGIRIHFHFDGVLNGCHAAGKNTRTAGELLQSDISAEEERYNAVTDAGKDVDQKAQGLDCVHEMNTINHYVGMFPIATGAPVEKPLAKFFFGFFAVLMLAFMARGRRVQLAVLALGFATVAVWMGVDQLVLGSLDAHVQEYMQESGTFFKEPERIAAWGNNVRQASYAVMGGLIVIMLIVLIGVARRRGFQLLLPLIPALLPLYFLVTYSAWLWFFGHNLHAWGAFTVKPFMPTVFGDGKVAQFTTHSYPSWGFGLLLVVFVCLMLALLVRRKQLREEKWATFAA